MNSFFVADENQYSGFSGGKGMKEEGKRKKEKRVPVFRIILFHLISEDPQILSGDPDCPAGIINKREEGREGEERKRNFNATGQGRKEKKREKERRGIKFIILLFSLLVRQSSLKAGRFTDRNGKEKKKALSLLPLLISPGGEGKKSA